MKSTSTQESPIKLKVFCGANPHSANILYEEFVETTSFEVVKLQVVSGEPHNSCQGGVYIGGVYIYLFYKIIEPKV